MQGDYLCILLQTLWCKPVYFVKKYSKCVNFQRGEKMQKFIKSSQIV